MTTTQENPMRLTRHVAEVVRHAHDRALVDLNNAEAALRQIDQRRVDALADLAAARERQADFAAALEAHRDAITRGPYSGPIPTRTEVDMRTLHAAGIASETAAARTAPFADFED